MDQLPAPAPAPAIPIQGAVFMGDIPSVRDLVPAAPPMLGPFNLNRRVAVGDNLDFEVLINAQGLVDYIRERLHFGCQAALTLIIFMTQESGFRNCLPLESTSSFSSSWLDCV